MIKKGKIIIVSGPSGVGKGTVLRKLVAETPGIKLNISATTRQKRGGEKNGQDYFFLSENEFEKKVSENAFLEWCYVHNNRYGTLNQTVDEIINNGCHLILEIDTKGAMKVKLKRPESVLIFIMPPDLETLKQRLEKRNTEDTSSIKARMTEAKNEIEDSKHYDFIIKNYTIDTTVAKIKQLIEQAKRSHYEE
jgi:guanylate kinase